MRLSGLVDWPSVEWQGIFDELDRMRRELDRIFESRMGGLLGEPRAGVFPLMNITHDRDNYYIRAELPGMKAEDLDISVTGDSLSISGERKIPDEGKDVRYHRRERESGRFNRIISLPAHVDSDKVEASFVNGVLTVVLPKAEEAKPKQISVKAA